ncbi:MAG TPA: DUF4041 domain-containing protein [Solirubrobacteraceae bacterium]
MNSQVEDDVATTDGPATPGVSVIGSQQRDESKGIPLFRARSMAKEFRAQLEDLRDRVDHLGLLSTVELEQRKATLETETVELAGSLARERERAVASVEKEATKAREAAEKCVEDLAGRQQALEQRTAELSEQVVITEETAILQEVGIYEYRHPLTDAVAYQAELKRLKDLIKVMALKDGGAVLADKDWTVNGSAPKGRAMVRDYSKLVLRAYNAEADNLVRALKPYKLDSATERLNKIAGVISKLGKTMNIRISDNYHQIRIKELELTADFLEKRAEEKERERAERERLHEERKVQEELARERVRLEKEHQHYLNVLARHEAKAEHEAITHTQEALAKIVKAIEDVDYRVANVRAGYVYVISNVGAFGEGMIKIGLTRRLDPTERVRELGDASVPFRYDTHALVFSADAVGLEREMHARLADRRVNRVNKRREFFYATPGEVKAHLVSLSVDLLEYTEVPEAVEYRQSVNEAVAAGEQASAGMQVPTSEEAAPSEQAVLDADMPIREEAEPSGVQP